MSLLSLLPARLQKPAIFALAGALGCLIATLLGEFWILMTNSTSAAPSGSVVLLIDCSGSMQGFNGILDPDKMLKVQEAAKKFSADLIDQGVSIGVVRFATTANIITPLTRNFSDVKDGIDSLTVVDGDHTFTELGLDAVTDLIKNTPDAKILLFTDGGADHPDDAHIAAQRLLKTGAKLIAVGTEDATPEALTDLTGDPKLVFTTDAHTVGLAFNQAQKIVSDSLIGSTASNDNFFIKILQVALWTSIIAIGLSLSLLIAQNVYLKANPITPKQAFSAALVGLAGGVLAGTAGHLLYAIVPSSFVLLGAFMRVLGWSLLGLLLGIGVARAVPNLQRSRALLGGLFGGFAGGFAFVLLSLILTYLIGNIAGAILARIAGAVFIGLAVGLMIAIAEAVFASAWLEVRWGPNDARLIALGETPVRVGSDRELCSVYAPNQPAELFRYSFVNGKVTLMTVPTASNIEIADGDQRKAGSITLQVKLSAAPNTTTATTPAPHLPAPSRPLPTPTQPLLTELTTAANFGLLVNGTLIPLQDNIQLHGSQIPGLDYNLSNKNFALLTRHPSQRQLVGLKNLSTATWKMTRRDGSNAQLATGQTAKLEPGTRLEFGALHATVVQT